MDLPMREFLQRALRTFGSPFKVKRERNPHRSAEETLESQTGPLQTGQKDEVQPTSASIDDAASIANKTPLSRASTRDGAKSTSEGSRRSSLMEPELTEGGCRIVRASDGRKDCWALLMTPEMIEGFKEITEEISKLDRAQMELDEVKSIVGKAEEDIIELAEALEMTSNADRKDDIREEAQTHKDTYHAKTREQELLEVGVMAHSTNLKYAVKRFHEIFKYALQDTVLWPRSEVEIETSPPEGEIETDRPSRAVRDNADSTTASETDESIVSVEELFRRNARDDLQYARRNLDEWENAFENRHDKYRWAHENYLEAVWEGNTSDTQTVFDHQAFEGKRDITRGLIKAEAYYEKAMNRAKALGVLKNDYYQESNFASEPSDGDYGLESGAQYNLCPFDREFIENWNDEVDDSGRDEPQEPPEPDDWDAKSIGFSDSISCVDWTRNRKRLDRWQETLGHR